jgi:hypothetical protein
MVKSGIAVFVFTIQAARRQLFLFPRLRAKRKEGLNGLNGWNVLTGNARDVLFASPVPLC